MSQYKLNNSDNYEPMTIYLSEDIYPIAYANKLKCLMDGACMSEGEAREEIGKNPIELELYYEKGAGLMAVESGAVDAGLIYSPYSGEMYEYDDEV
jgi:hypothetical protein